MKSKAKKVEIDVVGSESPDTIMVDYETAFGKDGEGRVNEASMD